MRRRRIHAEPERRLYALTEGPVLRRAHRVIEVAHLQRDDTALELSRARLRFGTKAPDEFGEAELQLVDVHGGLKPPCQLFELLTLATLLLLSRETAIQRSARIPVWFCCQRLTTLLDAIGGLSGALSNCTDEC